MPLNNSSTGGYLAPISAPITEDDDLDAQLQPVIAGITGLPGSLIRPRWQPIPPAQPDRSVNWCAFGIVKETADTNPTIWHYPNDAGGLGDSTAHRVEYLDIMASFYGPNCKSYAANLRDGLGIGQNREALWATGFAFVAVDSLTAVPELDNEMWIRRVDVAFSLRRGVIRTYAIENVVSLQAGLTADGGSNSGERTVTAPITTGLP